MGSLVDELRRRETAARAEAEQLRGQIVGLTERLTGLGGIAGAGAAAGDCFAGGWSCACARGVGSAAMAGRS